MRSRVHKAFTLQELLVVMIITGVIFIVVTDGFRLFGRFTATSAVTMNRSIEMLNNYSRLEALTTGCDTLYAIGDSVIEIKKGEEFSRLGLTTGAGLVLRAGERADTLFTGVKAICLYCSRPPATPSDTLKISVKQNDTDNYITMQFTRNYLRKESTYDRR